MGHAIGYEHRYRSKKASRLISTHSSRTAYFGNTCTAITGNPSIVDDKTATPLLLEQQGLISFLEEGLNFLSELNSSFNIQKIEALSTFVADFKLGKRRD